MNKLNLLELLAQIQNGTLTPQAASDRLAALPFEDLDFAKIDHHRSLRIGLPEVIYAEGKSADQTAAIFAAWPPPARCPRHPRQRGHRRRPSSPPPPAARHHPAIPNHHPQAITGRSEKRSYRRPLRRNQRSPHRPKKPPSPPSSSEPK